MNDCIVSYIGLGSNLGSPERTIHQALQLLRESTDVELVRTSDMVHSLALSDEEQPDYSNAVAEILTSLSPEALLVCLLGIEKTLGRERQQKWAARTIDLDLLLYGDLVIKTPNLTIPHPQMHLRSFVLTPLQQLANQIEHPVLKVSIGELAGRLQKQSFYINTQQAQLISIAGNIGVGKTTLAQKIGEALDAAVLFEPYDNNPFMPEVYDGQSAFALDSELHFLVNRAEQLDMHALVSGKLCVSDYLFNKDRVYTHLLLNQKQRTLYQTIYKRFSTSLVSPALLIYMEDSSTHCLDRIHRRNREYEQEIQTSFLEQLQSGYDELIRNWKICPVIRLDAHTFDCFNQDDLDTLVRQIEGYVLLGNHEG